MSNETIQRYLIGDYLNVSDTETPKYELMGVGFNTLDEEMGAQTDSKTYVNEKSATTTIKGYESKFPFESDLIKSQDAVMALYNVGRNHLTGADAQKDYVRVDLYNPVSGQKTIYPARKFLVSIEVSSAKGKGGENITLSGNLNVVGDFEEGYFDTSTKTFTTTQPTTVQGGN